ncbi:DnaA ATPase domain-containing protein, partial [Spiroplasma endosymbiont of Amphibalanus improvisus]|uniref:DnaA ATPase domain-containing protein n=1 Tax=Spiroplasma endosymbiont of Amphibalanus improvisus TaxID=3066327 RepID=UPI00313EE0E0
MSGQEIWSKIKDELANEKNVTYDTYNNYINKTNFITIRGNKLYLSINSKIGLKVITKLKDIMTNIGQKIFNESYEFIFLNSNEIKEDIPKEEVLNFKSNEKFTFNNYVRGLTNCNAYEAAKDVIDNIGNKWNPLFFYGDTGVGKTHLLRAIKNEILNKYKDQIKIHFVNSQDFGNEIATLLISKDSNNIQEFKNNYFKWDILIFDDIQVLSNRTKTNEILFNVFNYFIDNEKQIIFSSDRIPEKLAFGFEKRLVSRFSSGLTIKIDNPDYETAYKITTNLLNANGM